jgi:Cadherin-like beta sandwich domain
MAPIERRGGKEEIMEARAIERCAALCGRTSILAAAGPVALELRTDGDSELLAVTRDETFAFETRLETGAAFTVTLVDPGTPCTLRNQTGVIMGADTTIELTCTGASLASLVVSGIAPAVTLVPGMTDYVVDLPVSQQSVTLTATVAVAGDTLLIAGTPVDSGTPSAEITLNRGDNPVDIVVENAPGWQRTYRLTLRRAAELAQYAYAKASNTDEDDWFGYSVGPLGRHPRGRGYWRIQRGGGRGRQPGRRLRLGQRCGLRVPPQRVRLDAGGVPQGFHHGRARFVANYMTALPLSSAMG